MGNKQKRNQKYVKGGPPNASPVAHTVQRQSPSSSSSASDLPSAPQDGIDLMSDVQLLQTASLGDKSQLLDANSVSAAISSDILTSSLEGDVSVDSLRETLRSGIRHILATKAELEQDRVKVGLAHAKNEMDAAQLSSRTHVLAASESQLAKRAGEIETRIQEIRELEAAVEQEFPERQRTLRLSFEIDRQCQRSALETERNELRKERDELDAESAALREESRRLKREAANLEIQREEMTDREELATIRARAQTEHEFQSLKERFDSCVLESKHLAARLGEAKLKIATLEAKLAGADGVSFSDALAQRDRLRQEVDQLQMELSNRPGESTIDLYKKDHDRVVSLELETRRLAQLLAEKTLEADRFRISASEIEFRRIELSSIQASYELLKEQNAQLRTEVGDRLSSASSRSPYSELSRMDSDSVLQNPSNKVLSRVTSLRELVEGVRNSMEHATKPLFYSAATVRCFLAGLSMSKIQLLQGISGTGKTSLPRAFATATGGRADIVAVQAGWRDRTDLLGFYNAFDKKYHESVFLKALYAAQTPRWKDNLFFVVLDEMNLSHVEQFGADLLSELESPTCSDAPQLGLMDFRPPESPKHLLDGGSAIAVPKNVWFVGTANHDETTKDFADKTYDRAHTMVLPRNRTDAKSAKSPGVTNPVSHTQLAELFEQSFKDHRGETDLALKFVTELEKVFLDNFNITWGNRLERHIERFVPVVVASGGSCGEAIDHLVATKLLRKLHNRHDVRASNLKSLKTRLAEAWKIGKLTGVAEECNRTLDPLIRERSIDEGEAAS